MVCVVVTPHTDTSKHRVHTTQEHDAVEPQCMQDSDGDGVRKHVEKRISQRKVQKCWRQLYTAFKTPHGTYKDMKVPRNFECLRFLFHNNHHCKLVQLSPLEVKQNFQLKECNVWLEGPSYSSNELRKNVRIASEGNCDSYHWRRDITRKNRKASKPIAPTFGTDAEVHKMGGGSAGEENVSPKLLVTKTVGTLLNFWYFLQNLKRSAICV